MILQQLFKGNQLIGRDLVNIYDNIIFRGPIERISFDRHTSYVALIPKWLAVCSDPNDPKNCYWKLVRAFEIGRTFDLSAEIINPEEVIDFKIPGNGTARILPAGNNLKRPDLLQRPFQSRQQYSGEF